MFHKEKIEQVAMEQAFQWVDGFIPGSTWNTNLTPVDTDRAALKQMLSTDPTPAQLAHFSLAYTEAVNTLICRRGGSVKLNLLFPEQGPHRYEVKLPLSAKQLNGKPGPKATPKAKRAIDVAREAAHEETVGTYKAGVEWVALNDEPECRDRKVVAEQISVCMLSDLFNIRVERVADAIVAYREGHS